MLTHHIERKRHQTRRRTIAVSSIGRISPNMLRIEFTCSDFADFASLSPDDHIKLFFPLDDVAVGGTCMRDFTPRRFDSSRGVLVIDFAIHDAGPAVSWAVNAKVGDTLEIGGPRGSVVVTDDFDWYLLIGDETALPAIGRRLEELRPGVPVTSLIILSDMADAQDISTKAIWSPHWVERRVNTTDWKIISAAMANIQFPPGEGYIWIAAESTLAREVRNHVIDHLGHRKEWTKAAGYWTKGIADSHSTIED